METNLTAEKLIYYQLSGYTLYRLPKYRQVASGILTGGKQFHICGIQNSKRNGQLRRQEG
jgi:hypothetical protein